MKEGQSSNLHGASMATQIATTKKITKSPRADPKFQRLRGKKFEDYYVELDILYGDRGASSENQEVPGSNADHSVQHHTNSSATRKHGGVDQTLGLPTYHQTQTNTEQVIDRLPQLRIADNSSPPSAKNSRQYPGMSTSIQIIDHNKQPQNHSVASSSHLNAKNPGKNPDVQNFSGCNPRHGTSIADCLNEYNNCGFTKDDLHEATEIFRDPEYREMFIAFDKDHRPHWLKQLIIARMQLKQRGMLPKPN